MGLEVIHTISNWITFRIVENWYQKVGCHDTVLLCEECLTPIDGHCAAILQEIQHHDHTVTDFFACYHDTCMDIMINGDGMFYGGY